MASIKSRIRSLIGYAIRTPLRTEVFMVFSALLRKARIIPSFKDYPSNPTRRVLIVALTTYLGDSVMMLPLLDMLHETNPQVEIEVVVPIQNAALLSSISYISKVHAIKLDVGRTPILCDYKFLWKIIDYARRVLRDKDYDMCLLPRWGIDPYLSSYLAYLTNAPVRCGNDPREEIGAKAQFTGTEKLMTLAVRGGHGLPEAVRELRLLPAVGLIRGFNEKDETTKPMMALHEIAQAVDWKVLRERLGIDVNLKYGIIAPGASHPSRLWPAERYSQFISFFMDKYSLPFFLIGGAPEKHLGTEIERRSHGAAVSIIGMTSLTETVAILSRAFLFVGNDSGPAHIAAGLGLPSTVVSMCAKSIDEEWSSSPLRVRPVGPRCAIVQPDFPVSPCVRECRFDSPHCILSVSYERVIQETMRLLSDEKTFRSCGKQISEVR
jgi:ADP-heptose:LPS heptosyltransferase